MSKTIIPDPEPFNLEKDAVPPTQNSLSHDINKLSQPRLFQVFDEELATDNTVRLSGTFSGTDEISIQSNLHLSDKQGAYFSQNDEINLILRRFKHLATHRLSLKGNKIGLHSDFGHSFMKIRLAGWNLDSWINPYISIDSNRFLSKTFVSFGALSHTGDWAFKNSKFTFYRNHNQFNGDMVVNSGMQKNGFFLNFFSSSSIFEPLLTNERSVLAGFQNERAALGFKIEKNCPGSWIDWTADNARFSVAVDAQKAGIFGVEFFKNFLSKAWPKLYFAHQINASPELFVRTKIDNELNSSIYLRNKINEDLSLQVAARTSLRFLQNSSGLGGLPFSIGIKLSLNR